MTVLDATRHLLPGSGRRPLTGDEILDVEDILDAAREWAQGRLPWQEAARLGHIERNGKLSQSYSRFVALRSTSRDDPRRRDLIELCGHIDRMLGGVHTRHGRFTRRQMDEMEQQERVLFETGLVWRGVR